MDGFQKSVEEAKIEAKRILDQLGNNKDWETKVHKIAKNSYLVVVSSSCEKISITTWGNKYLAYIESYEASGNTPIESMKNLKNVIEKKALSLINEHKVVEDKIKRSAIC